MRAKKAAISLIIVSSSVSNITVAVVPEPGSAALGLIGSHFLLRCRRA